jgi:LemA protein
MELVFIFLGIILVVVVWYISANNKLIALKNNRENAFADIDVQLKQRNDLIPQLLGAVRGYMNHESNVFIRVTEARNKAISAKSINEKIDAENELSSAMGSLNIQVEAYPELKANTNFIHLQTEIGDIENKLASVRRFFNSATKELNNAIEKIPSNIVAGIKKMTIQPMFDLGIENRDQMEKAPEITF